MPTPVFPTISHSRVAMYPLERSTAWKTKVLRFLNDQEQRWVSHTPKAEFMLTYTGISEGDVATLYTFWTSVHGADITPFDLDLGTEIGTGVHRTYSNLVFVNDEFSATQKRTNLWDVRFVVRQLQ